MWKKESNDFCAIWVKMIDLQKWLGHRNLRHAAMKKIKSFCSTNHSTNEQVKKYKRKTSQWINEDKSVYICEDLAYKLIRYINLGVVEAVEFRKSLAITNSQSIQIETEMVAIIMKIFAKEIMVRQ